MNTHLHPKLLDPVFVQTTYSLISCSASAPIMLYIAIVYNIAHKMCRILVFGQSC